MSLLALLNQRGAEALQALGIHDAPPMVQAAQRPEFGDYQMNGVLAAARARRMPPRELARRVSQELKLGDLAARIELAGPGFINIRLDDAYLARRVRSALLDPRLAVTLAPRQRVMVEYSSVNLAKEMHVGHLRPTLIGDALARVLGFIGHEVIRQNHVGDWGTPFGMLLAHLESGAEGDTVLALRDLEDFYRSARLRFDSDPAFAARAREHVVKLQNGDAAVRQLWQRFRQTSLAHCAQVYRQLGVLLDDDDVRGESFYHADLPLIVRELEARGLLSEQDGARLALQSEFRNRAGQPLGYIVQKSDGAYLYATTDLGAIRFRARELQLDRCLYVVDARQSLHFQQLFALARKAGFAPDGLALQHIAHGAILGTDGRPLKTRSGDSVKLARLLDEAEARAFTLVSDKHPQKDLTTRRRIARAVGIGAVKYADLSKNRTSDYVFSWEQMLSFDGNTAPYLQYAYARIQSLLRKARGMDAQRPPRISHAAEHALALELIRFDEVVQQVAHDSQPHGLCAYLYRVATVFSRFYESCPVLAADAERSGRLQLCALTARTLETGLGLLGIQAVDEI